VTDWPTCEECGTGIRQQGFDSCLAHLKPADLKEFLAHLKPGADLDARGTSISQDLLTQLMDAVRCEFGAVNFERTEFEGAVRFEPLVARKLVLDGARFMRRAEIVVRFATWITCVGTVFEDGVTIRAHYAVINAERALFGGPSTITSHTSWMASIGYLKGDWASERSAAGIPGWYPALISLRETDTSNLTVVDVDLAWCLFAGAHRLDQIRIEGDCWYNSPPRGVGRPRRIMLAEEEYLKLWSKRHPFGLDPARIAEERVAGLYRSLRKALEDGKNEAGAGDFYFGEMEMRRRAESTRPVEKVILTAYWLLSGYGQRAGRAVGALVGLVAVVSTLLFTVGLPGVAWGWGRLDQSVRIGLGAVVFRDAGQQLTSAGAWTVMVARFLGPVLLALGVLAVRARVKR
jgi:hypothetical protein